MNNVIRLPTAARRKVQQRSNRLFREAAAELRAQWPGEYIAPHIREKLPDAAALILMERTPELCLALAIFQALEPEQQSRVRKTCDLMKHTGPEARGAAVAVQVRTIGDSVALDAACEVLRKRG